MKILSAAVLLCLAFPLYGAFEDMELGIPAMAMGGTGVVSDGLAGVLWNPAAAAGITGPCLSISGRLPYTHFDFTTAGVDGGGAITEKWNLAGSARWFGGDLYNEQMIAATIAGRLTGDFSFGLQPVVSRVAIKDGVSSYGSATAFSVNTGFMVTVYDRWRMGASVRNPFESRIGNAEEFMHRQMDAGVSYEPSDGMLTSFALSRDFRGTRVRVGGALPLGPLTIYAGAMSGPAVLTGGFSLRAAGIEAAYSVQTHPELDPSHAIGVTHAF
jgi:hypothetical protein